MFRARNSDLWYSKEGIYKRVNGSFVQVRREYQPNTLFGLAAAKYLDTNQKDRFADTLIKNSDEVFECVSRYEICDHNYACRCKKQLSLSTVSAKYVSIAAYEHIYIEPKFVYVQK